jgi:hypothetical protein
MESRLHYYLSMGIMIAIMMTQHAIVCAVWHSYPASWILLAQYNFHSVFSLVFDICHRLQVDYPVVKTKPNVVLSKVYYIRNGQQSDIRCRSSFQLDGYGWNEES